MRCSVVRLAAERIESVRKSLRVVGLLVGVQLLLLALYVVVQKRGDGASIAVDRLSQPAPELTLQTEGGGLLRLLELRGSTVVLHFWATWCPPCRDELPSLLEFASHGSVRVLAVSVDPEWAAPRSFVDAGALRHVYLASADEVSDAFGVYDLPQTLVIDATGTMRLRFRGARDWSSPTLRAMIADLD